MRQCDQCGATERPLAKCELSIAVYCDYPFCERVTLMLCHQCVKTEKQRHLTLEKNQARTTEETTYEH